MTTNQQAPKRDITLALATDINGLPDYTSRDVLDVIRAQFAKNATDAEFATTIALAKQYGLNVMAREIWCYQPKPGDPSIIVVSHDGFLSIAKKRAGFAGLKSGIVHQGDEFRVNAVTQEVTHTYGTERGAPVMAWAMVLRSDGIEPTLKVVSIQEQIGHSMSPWGRRPGKMLAKCARMDALKEAFGLSGLNGDETLGDMEPGDLAANALPAAPTGALSGVKRIRKPTEPVAKVEVVDQVATAPAPEVPPPPPPIIDAEFSDEEAPPVPPAEAPAPEPVAPAAPGSHLPAPAEFKAWLEKSGLTGADVKAAIAVLAKDDPTFPAKMGDTTPEQFTALENALIIIAQERKGA